MKEPEMHTHPSYGMVRFSRMSTAGKQVLFGSKIDTHHTIVSLTVTRGRVKHNLNRDWYYGGDELIEVYLSAAQFSELLTTMDMGSGVPCTITAINNKMVERPPVIEDAPERIRKSFRQETKRFGEQVRKSRDKIMEELSNLSKKRQDIILGYLNQIIQHIESNMPYTLDCFEESTEEVLTAAKTEVEAFALHAVQLAGLEALGKLPVQIEAQNQKQIEE